MIKLHLLIILFVFFGKLFAHPLHITVTNIDIAHDSIKILIRIDGKAIDDAVMNENTKPQLYKNVNINESINKTFKDYFLTNFKIFMNDNLITKDCKFKIDGDFIETIIGSRIENLPKELTIINTLLIDNVSDIRNMVILNVNNVEQGIEFNSVETKKTITLAK